MSNNIWQGKQTPFRGLMLEKGRYGSMGLF